MSVFRCSCALFLLAACARAPAPAPAPAPGGQAATGRKPAPQSSEERIERARVDSTREYRGEWESGFETSTFRGCNGTVVANVWLTLASGATAGVQWPAENVSGRNGTTYYVRVRGILRGPADRRRVGGGYGHLGSADYELFVTRLLEIKPPGEPNCVIKR